MKAYEIFCWFIILAIIASATALIITPEEEIYELVCHGEKAFVEYKHWSARVPNADELCQKEIKPTSLLM